MRHELTWHYDELTKLELQAAKERRAIDKMADKIATLRQLESVAEIFERFEKEYARQIKVIDDYSRQIERAERENRSGFDRDRFKA